MDLYSKYKSGLRPTLIRNKAKDKAYRENRYSKRTIYTSQWDKWIKQWREPIDYNKIKHDIGL